MAKTALPKTPFTKVAPMKLNERHKRFVELYKLSNRGWYAAIDCYKKVFVNCNNDKSASASAYKIS